MLFRADWPPTEARHSDAGPADLERITDAILAGKITCPSPRPFPVEQIRDAVTLQSGRHVHGKIVVTL